MKDAEEYLDTVFLEGTNRKFSYLLAFHCYIWYNLYRNGKPIIKIKGESNGLSSSRSSNGK